MNRFFITLGIVSLLWSCGAPKDTGVAVESNEQAYTAYGERIQADSALASNEILELYGKLAVGDTVRSKMTAEIIEVCPKKGCWMSLKTPNEEKVFVKFKDYAFFMPLDAKGKVVVEGKAFVTETPVDELKHYAEDAGKSAEEIAAITAPKMEYKFLANGVLLEQDSLKVN